MGSHWKVAERYSNILQRVLDEYGEYQQSAAIDGERSTPSTVKILADMRRCAFDLDFLISRQPRESPSTSSNNGNDPTRPSTSAIAPRNLAPNELEYLDVFGFFNVPRVPPTRAPDPNAAAGTPQLDMAESIQNPMSIHGLTSSAPVIDGNPPVNTNEFNITNYLIPTPETDWLFRPNG